jgi:hypothetical protein
MAIPPPPWSDITGISRAAMKDNAQATVVFDPATGEVVYYQP